MKSLSIILLFLLSATSLFAQGAPSIFPNYGNNSLVMSSTPGTFSGSAGAYWNPAGWASLNGNEAAFTWNDRNVTEKRMDNWGLFVGGNGVGFSARRTDIPNALGERLRVMDYQFALSGGDPDDYWGLSYDWSKGDVDQLNRSHSISLGNISRPSRYFSMGNSASYALDGSDFRGISDLGYRPLGSHKLTLFGDAAYGKLDNLNSMQWGVGAEIMPLNGIRIAGKISKLYPDIQDKVFTLSLGFSVDGSGVSIAPHYDKDNGRMSASYMIRVGDVEPSYSIDKFIYPEGRVVALGMKGSLTYQKSRWWDADKKTLMEMLQLIDDAKNDESVGGIALNLSGFNASREMFWELREKLTEFKSGGKKVYIYFDRAGMSLYNFASVADYVWIDPQGAILLPGYIAGRTFYKGFLEKIGIGVEEWRYFTYKSAMEGLARRSMSEADKEQRLEMITDFYDEWKSAVSSSRNLSVADLEKIIDSLGVLSAAEAYEFDLVDTLGRWDDAAEILEDAFGDEPSFIEEDEVLAEKFADPTWGEPPMIALVYTIGDCDMDSGIRGRYTSRLLRKLSDDDDVKAVVMRVDSPGGDALPSDLIADQMTNISNQKPMIVSQGSVAASGGYWISMNADKIYTSPYTITGSIGVIGGWIWNQGITDKTGFTSDFVKVGAHADMGFGITLPLIGLTVPDRNIDDEERARVEFHIRDHYKTFTKKVADARLLTTTYVDSIAQGRIWSGTRSTQNGLTDEIGGLEDAILYAKEQAGIKSSRKIKIVEYPRRSWLNFEELFQPASPLGKVRSALGIGNRESSTPSEDYEIAYLRRLSARAGQPLTLTPPEDLVKEDSDGLSVEP